MIASRCGPCGCLVPCWKNVCSRCEVDMAEGWPEA